MRAIATKDTSDDFVAIPFDAFRRAGVEQIVNDATGGVVWKVGIQRRPGTDTRLRRETEYWSGDLPTEEAANAVLRAVVTSPAQFVDVAVMASSVGPTPQSGITQPPVRVLFARDDDGLLVAIPFDDIVLTVIDGHDGTGNKVYIDPVAWNVCVQTCADEWYYSPDLTRVDAATSALRAMIASTAQIVDLDAIVAGTDDRSDRTGLSTATRFIAMTNEHDYLAAMPFAHVGEIRVSDVEDHLCDDCERNCDCVPCDRETCDGCDYVCHRVQTEGRAINETYWIVIIKSRCDGCECYSAGLPTKDSAMGVFRRIFASTEQVVDVDAMVADALRGI